jgi:hypothetical protein
LYYQLIIDGTKNICKNEIMGGVAKAKKGG